MPNVQIQFGAAVLSGRSIDKKVTTQHTISLSAMDCAVIGWNVARLLGKLTLALIFKRNPYRLF